MEADRIMIKTIGKYNDIFLESKNEINSKCMSYGYVTRKPLEDLKEDERVYGNKTRNSINHYLRDLHERKAKYTSKIEVIEKIIKELEMYRIIKKSDNSVDIEIPQVEDPVIDILECREYSYEEFIKLLTRYLQMTMYGYDITGSEFVKYPYDMHCNIWFSKMYSPELLSKELTYYKMKEGYLQAIIKSLCDHLGHDYIYDKTLSNDSVEDNIRNYSLRYICKDCGRFGYDVETEQRNIPIGTKVSEFLQDASRIKESDFVNKAAYSYEINEEYFLPPESWNINQVYAPGVIMCPTLKRKITEIRNEQNKSE